jgi:hypothetical protein
LPLLHQSIRVFCRDWSLGNFPFPGVEIGANWRHSRVCALRDYMEPSLGVNLSEVTTRLRYSIDQPDTPNTGKIAGETEWNSLRRRICRVVETPQRTFGISAMYLEVVPCCRSGKLFGRSMGVRQFAKCISKRAYSMSRFVGKSPASRSYKSQHKKRLFVAQRIESVREWRPSNPK